ncbi:uncharacterized protein Hap1MRO34_004165 isoform 2-T2 [Clarias gariepinus]
MSESTPFSTSSTDATTTAAVPQMISTEGAEPTTSVAPVMASTEGAETTSSISATGAETTATVTPQMVSTTGEKTTTPAPPLIGSTTGAKTATPGWLQRATSPEHRSHISLAPNHSSIMRGELAEAPVLSDFSDRHGGLVEPAAVLVVVSSFCLVVLVILVIVVLRCLILRRGKYNTREQNKAEDPKDELENFSDEELPEEIYPMNEQNDAEDLEE